MLLPEFLGSFEDEEDSAIVKPGRSKKKKKGTETVPDNNSSVEESHLSGILSGDGSETDGETVEHALSNPSPAVSPVVSNEDLHFHDWHVSEEFVREEKVRKERQEERERRYQAAKAKAESQHTEDKEQNQEPEEKAPEKNTTESFSFSQPVAPVAAFSETPTSEPAKTIASVQPDAPVEESVVSRPSEPVQNVVSVRTTENADVSESQPSVGSESVDHPGRVVFVQEDVSHYVAPSVPEFDETLTPLPESARKENTLLNVDSAQDDSEMVKSLEINAQHEGREMELHESFRRDTDSIVMSGYQNDPGTFGTDDILASYDQPFFNAEPQSFAPIGVDSIVEPSVSTTEETSVISSVEMPAEAPVEIAEETPVIITEESPVVVTDETPVDIKDETSEFEFDNAPKDDFSFSFSDKPVDEVEEAQTTFQPESVDDTQPEEPAVQSEMQFDMQPEEPAVQPEMQFDTQPEEPAVQPENQFVMQPEEPVAQPENQFDMQPETLDDVQLLQPAQEIDTAGILSAINETEIPTVEIPDVPSASDDRVESVVNTSEDMATFGFDDISGTSGDEEKEINDRLAEAAASFGMDANDVLSSGTDDEQLNTFLDRLDMSDSIKRMNESAREDMADVIEQEKDQNEDEVVLVNEDYNFGDDSEYGQVPTISDLEDKWRMEQELRKTPEENIPDVVSGPAESSDADSFMKFDDLTGFDKSVSEEVEKKPNIIPFEPEVIERMKPEPIEDTEEEFEEETSEDVSSKITTSEVGEDGFHGMSFMDIAREQEHEPVHVANRVDESPVFSFTKKDDNIDSATGERSLGIPKPGDKPLSSYVDRYAASTERSGKPIAASLDRYEKRKEQEHTPIHTEEVVSRSASGSRSYHKIILK